MDPYVALTVVWLSVLNVVLVALLLRGDFLKPVLRGRHRRSRAYIRHDNCFLSVNDRGRVVAHKRQEDPEISIQLYEDDAGIWFVEPMAAGWMLNERPLDGLRRLYTGSTLRHGQQVYDFQHRLSRPLRPTVAGHKIIEPKPPGGASFLFTARREPEHKIVLLKEPDATNTKVDWEEFKRLLKNEAVLLDEAHAAAVEAGCGWCFPEPLGVWPTAERDDVLVMEYVQGKTLFDAMSEWPKDSHHPWTLKEVVSVALGVAEALEVLASCQIVHCDLKPSNVVLRGNDPCLPCLVDFGIAVRSGGRTPGKTERYTSPEHAKKPVLPASDVYVLAILVENCLQTIPNFGHAEAHQLRSLLQDMRAPEPEGRPSAAQVKSELTAYLRALSNGA